MNKRKAELFERVAVALSVLWFPVAIFIVSGNWMTALNSSIITLLPAYFMWIHMDLQAQRKRQR